MVLSTRKETGLAMAVKTTLINVDYLVCDLKLERLCEHNAQHHIAVLVESRTNMSFRILLPELPTYTVYHRIISLSLQP